MSRWFGVLIVAATISQTVGAAEPIPTAADLTGPRERPSMLVSMHPTNGLRTVDQVRGAIQHGHAHDLWTALLAKVDEDLAVPVVTPMREEDGKRVLGNRSYSLVATAAHRILDTALVALVTEDQQYVDAALAQIMALFDEDQWPEWSDQAHLNKGMHADLRHGQLVVPVALTYDWLYHQFTPEERKAILDGLTEHAIKPYKAGFEAGEHWSRRRSNWMTVVLGGFGIAGMALGPDHPDSAMLVANALPKMESYLDILGPEGSFNESVQYAGSMAYVVRFFNAMRYASGGRDTPFERHGLGDFYRWYLHMTFPPGRVAGFGDPAADMPPVVVPAASVASATRDPLLQWFYEQYYDKMLDSHRYRSLELLAYDATLEAESPDGKLPLGRAYHHQGKLVSSRSSWDPRSAASVVYGKAGREDYHSHADWGQLCLDGYGDRLIVDLGSPPGYPDGGYEHYYNYQQFGHNVFVFGNTDTGGVSYREKKRNGKFTHTAFDDSSATWTIDLSEVYGEGYAVTRKVFHLLPRVVVVLDEATLPEVQPISLRWHSAKPVEVAADGSFLLKTDHAQLAARVQRLDGDGTLRTGHHAYAEPYNRHRLGTPFEQRHEPYVELIAEDDHCRVLTLFAVYGADDEAGAWEMKDGAWGIETAEGAVTVNATNMGLMVEGQDGQTWETATP